MAATLAFLRVPTTIPSSSSSYTSSHARSASTRFFPIDKSVSLSLTASTLPFLLSPQDAVAAGGEFGILEGRSLALIHPIVMGGLFLYTLYAGYLGWQWRRVRTLQDEINQLKKQDNQPPESDEAQPASPLQLQIQKLSEERKELIKGQYRDKHFNAGSILLGFGVFESIGGGVNTYLRTGKLFPGPHLYAGAGFFFVSCLSFGEGRSKGEAVTSVGDVVALGGDVALGGRINGGDCWVGGGRTMVAKRNHGRDGCCWVAIGNQRYDDA